MTDAINPYRSPEQSGAAEAAASTGERIDLLAVVAWPVVFGLNLIIPGLIGWGMTTDHGRVGMALAVGAFLTCGWLLCWRRPTWARRLILGAIPIACSQFFPLLQMLAGVVAVEMAGAGGAFHRVPGVFLPELTSELGGFVVTFLVGLQLLGCAAVLGALLAWLLPARFIAPHATRGSNPPLRNFT